jgi:hypothetical protein
MHRSNIFPTRNAQQQEARHNAEIFIKTIHAAFSS